MKLYSRSQLLLISLCSAIGAIMLVFGGVAIGFNAAKNGKPAVASSTKPEAIDSLQVSQAIEARPVQSSTSDYSVDELQNINVYAKYNQAVVNISTEVMGVNWFSEPVPMQSGSGSGSIIDARGYILTNNHVVENAYKVYVSFADGTRLEGKVHGTDPENDLAIVSFTPPSGKALTTIPYGDSSNLRVGQKVLAIGNPFGYFDRTLTTGIVSALGRPIQESKNVVINDMIQTDAAINPGNSGGPLLNSRGEMIGINTMIYSETGGSVGIGFAIPVNTAKRIVTELIKYGTVKRGWIDATYIVLNPDLADAIKQQGYPLSVTSGLLVSQVKQGGNADSAGIRGGKEAVRYGRSGDIIYLGGDVIVGVDGRAIKDYASFLQALESKKPGEKVGVDLIRGGKKLSMTITLSSRSDKSNIATP
jgi:S1-C subfamily serine protease